MVTTTVRMLDGVHGNTSNSGPVSLLGLGLEVGSVGLEDGLVSSLATGNDANHASAGRLHGLSDSGRKSDSGLSAVLGVTDDDAGGAGSTGKNAAVSLFGLDVGDDGTLGHGADGEDVANSEGGLRSGVNELAGVHALDCDEKLSVLLVFVLVFENDLGEGGTTAGVVHDVSHNALDVSSALDVVQSSEASWGDSLRGVSLEDGTSSASLRSDNSSHE